MGEIDLDAHITGRYDVDRQRTDPVDLARVWERKIREALEPEGVELTIDVTARDR